MKKRRAWSNVGAVLPCGIVIEKHNGCCVTLCPRTEIIERYKANPRYRLNPIEKCYRKLKTEEEKRNGKTTPRN